MKNEVQPRRGGEWVEGEGWGCAGGGGGGAYFPACGVDNASLIAVEAQHFLQTLYTQ